MPQKLYVHLKIDGTARISIRFSLYRLFLIIVEHIQHKVCVHSKGPSSNRAPKNLLPMIDTSYVYCFSNILFFKKSIKTDLVLPFK